jgi:hypothetical protein
MDFYSLLDEVMDLLRRRGRVTYRALKRQFHLDDEVLDDLKEELTKAQRVAVDDNGAQRVGRHARDFDPLLIQEMTSRSPLRGRPHPDTADTPPGDGSA